MDLQRILRCPRCRGALIATDNSFNCNACQVRYPIVDGLPYFDPSHAQPIADEAARNKR